MPKLPKSARPVNIATDPHPAISPDPAVFTTTEERQEIFKTLEPAYSPPKNAVRMLQPWRCRQCKHAGEFQCHSTDSSIFTWDNIVRIHKEHSPECHDKFLVVGNWRVADETNEVPF